MTAAQAIKELECIKFGIDRHARPDSVVGMQDGIAREAGIDFAIDVLREIIQNPFDDWTPISKGKPARGEVVIVTVQDGPDRYTCEAYIHSISGRWAYGTGCGASVDGKVIAWRPKLEPYQGDI